MIGAIAFALLQSTVAGSQAAVSEDICPVVATTPDDRACLEDMVGVWDAAITREIPRVLEELGGEDTPAGRALLTDQAAWVAYRDQACLAYPETRSDDRTWSLGQRCKSRIRFDRVVMLQRMRVDLAVPRSTQPAR